MDSQISLGNQIVISADQILKKIQETVAKKLDHWPNRKKINFCYDHGQDYCEEDI